MNKFKSYISCSKFDTILYIEYKTLLDLFKNRKPNNARQTRLIILLSMLNVKVMNEPGNKNIVTDIFSRIETVN